MRVLIVSPSYLPEIGAAPSRITNMAEGLSGIGIKVLDVCLDLEETVGPSCQYVRFRHDPLVFRSQA